MRCVWQQLLSLFSCCSVLSLRQSLTNIPPVVSSGGRNISELADGTSVEPHFLRGIKATGTSLQPPLCVWNKKAQRLIFLGCRVKGVALAL